MRVRDTEQAEGMLCLDSLPPMEEPEIQARQLLKVTWVFSGDDKDSFPLPVNPFLISQRLGIQTYTATLKGDVAGMLVKREREEPEIYVHAHDNSNRQRFTCAHELGHYNKRSQLEDLAYRNEWEYVDFRDLLSSGGTDPEEVYANKFAASLLMPREAIVHHYEELGAVALAYKCGVSPAAMNFRLRKLGLK